MSPKTLDKYRVCTVTARSWFGIEGGTPVDIVASGFLQSAGFVDTQGRQSDYIHLCGRPRGGRNIFVYYAGKDVVSEGSFVLVGEKVEGGEEIIDRGTVNIEKGIVKQPGRGGKAYLSFSARGSQLAKWEFLCEPKAVDHTFLMRTPGVFVIQSSFVAIEILERVFTKFLGMKENVDFRFITLEDQLDLHFASKEASILIMGSKHGEVDHIPALRESLRAVNPNLIVVGLATKKIEGVDLYIPMVLEKGREMEETLRGILGPLIKDYLATK